MKVFIVKVFLFLGILCIGVLALYEIFDRGETTIGDYRYNKVRKIVKTSNSYNTLLIGSSRVINIGDTIVGEDRIYNFGILNGMPAEYAEFIKFGIATKPIRKIIVGLDFYGTSVEGLKGINDQIGLKKPDDYLMAVNKETPISSFVSKFELPRFKRLVNSILFDNMLKDTGPSGHVDWDLKHWNMYIGVYSHYKFNQNIGDIYADIRSASESSDAQLKVFITPISRPLFELLLQNNLQADYERFLRIAVETYGTVYNFMEINDFTSSPENFIDENHTTNERLFEMVQYVAAGESAPSIQGTKLDSSVIDDYILHKRYIKR